MTSESDPKQAAPRPVRCAIYTRKSTDEGLALEFNSLDAQRESAEAYVASQKSEGWVCLPDRYDDGGFTGGNMERPALARLLEDIEAGKVDCVVVYKVDRLSRSLLDFARIMDRFDAKGVLFVSVTQQFNTSHSMGRLTLHILLSFAQFEREIISERTRDKIAAARRKGKWAGGHPLLGYDIQSGPGGSKLLVNPSESRRVRKIFEMYLKTRSIRALQVHLDDLGWRTKAWTTKAGAPRGGRRFDKPALWKLLTNPTYLGKVRHGDRVYEGEHEAIIDEDLFRRVQAALRRNGSTGGGHVRNKHGALLKGLLRCRACGCGMTHHYVAKGKTRYTYYVCQRALRDGYKVCPGPSLRASDIEGFVVDRIREFGQDGETIFGAIRSAQRRLREALARDQALRAQAQREIERLRDEMHRLECAPAPAAGSAARLASLNESLAGASRRARALDRSIGHADDLIADEDELCGAVEAFDPVFQAMTNAERARLVRLIVRQVEWDPVRQMVTVVFHDGDLEAPAEAAA